LAGGQSRFLFLFPDAITFRTILFYDDIFYRVFIGHRERKLNLLSKSYEKINSFGILNPSGHFAISHTDLN